MSDTKINTYQCVIKLRERIVQACKEAVNSLEKAGQKCWYYANRRTKLRTLKPGDKVLILLPEKKDCLLISYQ